MLALLLSKIKVRVLIVTLTVLLEQVPIVPTLASDPLLPLR